MWCQMLIFFLSMFAHDISARYLEISDDGDFEFIRRDIRPVNIDIEEGDHYYGYGMTLKSLIHNVINEPIPLWYAVSQTEKNYSYGLIDSEYRFQGHFYEDTNFKSLLSLTHENNTLYYDGIIGEGVDAKVVRSFPEKWPANGREIREKQEAVGPFLQKYEYEKKLNKHAETLSPKLLVIVDNTLFRKFDNNINKTVKYVTIFWNAVNMKYREIESTEIKIIITGIIIEKDENAMKYIHLPDIKSPRTNENDILNHQNDYFLNDFKEMSNYDATVTMTNLTFAKVPFQVTYHSNICKKEKNVALVQDDGQYSGILQATSDLGYLLKMPLDSVIQVGPVINSWSDVDFTKPAICKYYFPDNNTVTVMGPHDRSPSFPVKHIIWSNCSISALEEFARNKDSECLKHP